MKRSRRPTQTTTTIMTATAAPRTAWLTVAAILAANAPVAFADSAAPTAAVKDAKPRKLIIGILDVRVDGMPAEAAARFEAKLTEQLDTGHYWLATRARMHELLAGSPDWIEGCVAGPCLSVVKTQTSAERVVSVYLHGKGTSFGSVVTLFRTDTGAVVKQHAEHCDACTVNEAVDQSILATIGLVALAPDELPDEARDNQARLAAAIAPVRAEQRRQARGHRRVGIALTVVGVAAAASGLLLRNQTNNHRDLAYGLLGGGAGTAASGLLVLTF